ncbi:MAG TPA: ketopantoate reductase family protein [Candidatus Binataceae bacterium]|nr:ketopantoate reductase family protein [Candidatus Binataceae bacterium]
MKILVMGAGAIGAFYGAWLQRAGEEVYYCARGEHLRAMKERGLAVKSINGDFHLEVKASSDPSEFAPYELILFCVKSQDTVSAAKQLIGCLAEGGAVLTLQNGVENEALLCEVFRHEQVMGGNARVGAEITVPGQLLHTVGGNAEIGELDGRKSERVMRIAESFRNAGVLGEVTEDLRTIRWHKLMGNNGTNTVCTLGRCSVGAALADPEGIKLVRQLFVETVWVGRAEGAKLTDEQADRQIAQMKKYPNLMSVRPSTLQDYEKGKRLEYDAITGAILRAAKRHGISVPATETVHALLKLLDAGLAARA